LGLSYAGQHYSGWQSQSSGNTIQDHLEAALARFAGEGNARITTLCAGRTDAGVHGLMQVVHFDAPVQRPVAAWVRGTNTFLPSNIAETFKHLKLLVCLVFVLKTQRKMVLVHYV